ncbi:MAG: tetratricopeptide repeat protein [Chitinophagaceae bacterium]|nr:tetratricopeptide repeat protein [Chitinophagaceae bacterium]
MADYYFGRLQYDSALMMANNAVKLAESKKYFKGQGWALVKAVEILIEKKDLQKADELALQINKIANREGDTLLNSVSILQRGQVKMYREEYDQAILLFDKSIKSGLGLYPNMYLALAFNDLGYAWGLKDEYQKQAEFTHKSLSIYEQLNNDEGIAMALGNLSTVYFQMGQAEKAIEYGKQCLKYRQKTGDKARISITCCNLSQYYVRINKEEAAKYQKLCVQYAKESGDEARIMHSYITSSLVANAKNDNKEAFDYELKVIDMLERSKANQRMLARRYIAAAFYTDMLKYDSVSTLEYYDKSILLANELKDRSTLKDLYLYLSDYYSRKKNHSEALIAYKKHILLRDSLVSAEKEERIAELEKQYEISKKDNEIERLQKDQRINQLEIEKQKAIIAGNMAVALQKQNEIDLLSKSRELQDTRIRQQEGELEKKELIATANQQQLELAAKEKQLQERKIKNQQTQRNLLLAGLGLVFLLGYTYFNRYQLKKKLEQQKSLLAMRNNISRDLHDDIGASLSNINILNELAKRNIDQPEKSKEYLSKASEDIQQISESLSDIVWNINPKYDDIQNLFVRMKRYAADMMDGKNINGQFEFPADETSLHLTMTQRRDLYLIFKEAINNLVKYSGAREATVRLNADKNNIILRVEDNGKGFDRQLIKQGNGLSNMEQRAKVSGAELNIFSGTGRGTTIELIMKVA